jgi:uncharacterized protein YdaL
MIDEKEHRPQAQAQGIKDGRLAIATHKILILTLTIITILAVGLLLMSIVGFCAETKIHGQAQASTRPPSQSTKRVMVLYDSSGELGWRGQLHAQCLRNLLGHFPVAVAAKEIENYTAGEMESYDVTFYLGSVYDNAIPKAFLKDVLKSSKTVCWLGYNLWQVAWSKPQKPDPSFEKKFGFRFAGLEKSHYPEVYYRGFAFTRNADNPDLGLVTITDLDKAKEVATCHRRDPFTEVPYVVHGANFWYVADIPFTYIAMYDRYLILTDLLHDILGINQQERPEHLERQEHHRGLIRIEDVHGKASPQKLREIADYLHSEGVAFSVAVIPVYYDPKGVYNWGASQTIRLSKKREVVAALKYMVARGGEIVLHGLTHQWDSESNPRSGVSAEDYEFYRVRLDAEGKQVLEGPVPEDSLEWVSERVEQALIELKAADLTPIAWETPHYLASELDNKYFGRRFNLMIHRGIYFVIGPDGVIHFTNQFFPYVIYRDVYGQKLAPENLFCFATRAFMGEPPSTVPTMLYQARLNLAVRDSWASFFFHWYQDIRALKELVRGLKAMGYEFVPLSSLQEDGEDRSLGLIGVNSKK